MTRCAGVAAVALVLGTAWPVAALAFTTPFHFHCRGDACRAIAFVDEGNGCTVATNYGRRNVHVTQGPFDYDLAPGQTHAELINAHCAGYYDGGETADFY